MRFKPGDTIRCVNPGPANNALTLNKTYTVEKVNSYGMVQLREYVRPGQDDATPAEFFDFRFVLVTRNMADFED